MKPWTSAMTLIVAGVMLAGPAVAQTTTPSGDQKGSTGKSDTMKSGSMKSDSTMKSGRAGRMGGEQVTTQNLTIHAIDADKGLVLILGAVPGPKNGVVFIKSAVKNHSKVGA